MPNSATFCGVGRHGHEVAGHRLGVARGVDSSQSRAVVALVIVSRVVKVLELMMNSVSAGSRSRVASQMSLPSTLDTKRHSMRRSL